MNRPSADILTLAGTSFTEGLGFKSKDRTKSADSSKYSSTKCRNQSTELLSPQQPSPTKNRTVTVDSKGITIIETGFSKVTLDKLTLRVTKIPQGPSHHQMFVQEIRNMIYLADKDFDVGLIEYDDGNSQKLLLDIWGRLNISTLQFFKHQRQEKYD